MGHPTAAQDFADGSDFGFTDRRTAERNLAVHADGLMGLDIQPPLPRAERRCICPDRLPGCGRVGSQASRALCRSTAFLALAVSRRVPPPFRSAQGSIFSKA